MGSKFETGHAKNVANLEKLNAFVRGYGAAYQPSKTSIQLAALEKLLEEARASLVDVNTHLTATTLARNRRMELFKKLPEWTTRLINAFAITDVSDKTLEDARAIGRKIKGIRLSKKEDAPLATEVLAQTTDTTLALYVPSPSTPDAPALDSDEGVAIASRSRSSAQTSRDQLIEHFARLVALLESSVHYQPRETELQVSTLNQYLEELRNTNSAVISAEVALSNARLQRNVILYAEKTGLCAIAQDVKQYVKAVFGAKSPQYKQISGLLFKPIY